MGKILKTNRIQCVRISNVTSEYKKVNVKKCKEILFDPLQYRLPLQSPLYMGGCPIDSVQSFKLLGVYRQSLITNCSYLKKNAGSVMEARRWRQMVGENARQGVKLPFLLTNIFLLNLFCGDQNEAKSRRAVTGSYSYTKASSFTMKR